MSLVKVNFFSESLMRTVNFIAILPIDKRSVDGNQIRGKDKPFKTLYLLHGVFGSEYDWLSGTRVQRWAQDRNLAVIMPAGENKFYSDSEAASDNFGRFIGEELVNFTRTMFRLSERREDTYIAGLSMGGMGALLTGLRYPETFGAVGAFSAALIAEDYPADDTAPVLIRKRSYYEAVLGPEASWSGSRNDYKTLAAELVREGRPIPKLYMVCGESDGLLGVNRDYHEYLTCLGIPVSYEEGPGAHEWDFWDRYLLKFMDWLPLEGRYEGRSSGHID